MICKACGREIANENANYCEYCGTSFRERDSFIQPSVVNEVREQYSEEESKEKENEGTISFGNWIGTMILPFIPFVGIFIYIVMLFVWAFGSETPKSKKNWARATLIVSIIGIIIFAWLFTNSMMDLMNSGFDFNDYMKQMTPQS